MKICIGIWRFEYFKHILHISVFQFITNASECRYMLLSVLSNTECCTLMHLEVNLDNDSGHRVMSQCIGNNKIII